MKVLILKEFLILDLLPLLFWCMWRGLLSRDLCSAYSALHRSSCSFISIAMMT